MVNYNAALRSSGVYEGREENSTTGTKGRNYCLSLKATGTIRLTIPHEFCISVFASLRENFRGKAQSH